MDYVDKKVLFIHKDGSVGGATISIHLIDEKKLIDICTFNNKAVQTGMMKVYQGLPNEYYIPNIYCYTKFRHNGIGSMMHELIEYLLRDEKASIGGTFWPYQASSDTCNIKNYETLFANTRDFYKKMGYEFYLSKDVVKIKKDISYTNNNFIEDDNIIYEKTLLLSDKKIDLHLLKKLQLR